MTDPNRTKKRYELYDVDGDDDDENHVIHSHQPQAAAAAAPSSTPVVVVVAAAAAVPPTKPNLFQLPDGRMMDSKNTLQSFDQHHQNHQQQQSNQVIHRDGDTKISVVASAATVSTGTGIICNSSNEGHVSAKRFLYGSMTDPSGDILSTNHSYVGNDEGEYDHDSNLNSNSHDNSNSSHATTLPTPATTSPPPATATDLMFPDGRIIDGKNTLQSFDAPPMTMRQATMKQQNRGGAADKSDGNETERRMTSTIETTPIEPTQTVHLTNRNNNNNNLGTAHNGEDVVAIHAEATPIHSIMVVDAEIANSRLEAHCRSRSWLFWLLNFIAMMLVGVVVGVGVYCGTGNCGGDIQTEVAIPTMFARMHCQNNTIKSTIFYSQHYITR